MIATLLLAGCGGGGGGGGGGDESSPGEPVALSGLINASERQYIDGDPNDPVAPPNANNSRATAQPVANPSTIGGFLSETPTGVPGDRFATESDRNDYYAVDLIAGQRLTLEIAENADLDLFLEDENGNVVASSVLAGNNTDSISFNGPAGRYFVNAFAFSGASNYLLRIGIGTASASHANPWEQDIVPGELIVRFEDESMAAAGNKTTLSSLASGREFSSMMLAGGAAGTERLLRMDATSMSGASMAASSELPRELGFIRSQFNDDEHFQTWLAHKRMALAPQVASVQMNYRVQAQLLPNDTFYGRQWHYPAISLPQAWDTTQGSSSTIIAIVDTGIVSSHPDLANKLTNTGFDFVSSARSAGDGNGIDNNPEELPDPSGVPSVYHGSHVAGTAAAQTNDSRGAAGVDWQARIMPIRVLGLDGGGSTFDVLQGVRYAAGMANDSGIILSTAQRADIINLSLGGGGNCLGTPTANLYQSISDSGILVVAAAGNESSSQPSSPASCPGVFSVSATRLNNSLAPYSNFGSSIDLAAPGGDTQLDQDSDGFPDGILSSWFNDADNVPGLRYLNGTSMASPHVAGVFGLMLAVAPDLSPVEVENLLIGGQLTRDIGAAGRDNFYGYGLIDAAQAVASASVGAQPFLRLQPQRLDFTQSGNQLVTLSEPTGESTHNNVSVTDNVTGTADWLSATSASVGADGLGDYRISVDTSVLSDEIITYNGVVTFTTNTGLTVDLPVSLRRIAATNLTSNVGVQFVLLIDAETSGADEPATLFQDVAFAADGAYRFNFEEIPPGRYILVSGSDIDNDGFICDEGESCGGFPTEAESAPITIISAQDRSGLDFGTGYISAPQAATVNDGGFKGFRLLQQPAQAKQLQ